MNSVGNLESRARELLIRDKLPGAAVALIEQGSTKNVFTWGFADKVSEQPVRRSTLFNVASISKPFTSWGIMKLVERGLVDLDDPVEAYLGGWRLPRSDYEHDLITIRRLLSHTGGINTEGIKAVAPSAANYATIDVLEGRLPPLDEQQRRYCLEWGIDPDHDRRPAAVKFPPAEAFHYSNMGFVLLQLLIESVSGRAFADFMQMEVLDPLGMPTAGFRSADSSNPQAAFAHRSDGTRLPFYRHVALAAGGLFCSIEDLAAFACAELAGGCGVISTQGMAILFEKQCFAETLDGLYFDSGLGHYRLEVGGLTFLMHSGGVLGWRSVYGVIPQTGHGFCALINSDGGNSFWMTLLQTWFRSVQEGSLAVD